MKSEEQIEQSLRRLDVEVGAESRKKTRDDLVAAHAQHTTRTRASRPPSFGRQIMRQTPLRIAAVVTFAVVLIGAIDLGTGSTALSQARHVANTTLSWLRGMIAGDTTGEPPSLPPQASVRGEQGSDSPRKVVTCAARFFRVPASDQAVWRSLKDQGIDFIAVSTDPEVYYAVLSREQAASVGNSITLPCVASPRVMLWEGDTAALAVTNAQPRGGLALACLPTVASDGKEVQSTISFHDGHNGFEIPNVSTEPGGVVLIRAKGIFSHPGPDTDGSEETLIRVQVDVQ